MRRTVTVSYEVRCGGSILGPSAIHGTYPSLMDALEAKERTAVAYPECAPHRIVKRTVTAVEEDV